MARDAEQLAAAVSGQAVNKQAEEDGAQDLAQQHGQARLALLARGVQEANKGGNAWGERDGGRKERRGGEQTLVDYLLEQNQLLQKKTQFIFEFRIIFFTRPLSGRSVRLNRLADADGSVWLLLRKQHALIHRPCEVVHMAAAASRKETRETHTHKAKREFGKVIVSELTFKKKPK